MNRNPLPSAVTTILRGGPLDGIEVAIYDGSPRTTFFGIPDLDNPGLCCWYPYQRTPAGGYRWGEDAGA